MTYTFTTTERGPREEVDLTPKPTPTGGLVGCSGSGQCGGSIYGYRVHTGVNRDLDGQPDARIRELNREEPVDGECEQVWCTKIGTTHPDKMFIIGAHMDGHGVNEAVNDNASVTALVMELVRILSDPGGHIRTQHPLCLVEQRGNRSERFPCLCRAAPGHTGH